MGERRRLFVAVEVPSAVSEAVVDATAPLRAGATELRWTRPEQQHLTLAFLGHVPVAVVPQLEAALAAAAAPVPPFSLALDGTAGTFGGRVLWARLAPAPELDELAERVRANLAGVDGLPASARDDRPFHAHLTLARPRERRGRLPRGLAGRYEGPRATWRVDRLVLMRSDLRRGGARYAVESAWELTGEGG